MSAAQPTQVILAVVLRHGRICIARRSEHVATSRGLWSVVTGYLEAGIAPVDQAWLELAEELGLGTPEIRLSRSLPPIPLASVVSGKQFVVHPFLFEAVDECEATLNWEHTDVAWVEPERLAEPDCVTWQRDIVVAMLQQPAAK